MDIGKCSAEAEKMYETRKGYRDDSLFGEYGNEEGYHDPVEVLLFEILELDNMDSLEFFHKNYMPMFTEDEKEKFEIFMNNCSYPTDYAQSGIFSHEREFRSFLEEIIRKVIEERNYCVWLCANPKDIYDSYVLPYKESALPGEYDERVDNYDFNQIDEYTIPSDAIILADNGYEGCLWCWKK